MKLTREQAKDIITKPTHKLKIDSARNQESQLRVFTEELDFAELSNETYFRGLKQKMRTRSSKKFDRVFEFARYPLPTVQITDSILSDYFKVFDGKNRSFNIDGDRDLSLLNKWVTESNLEKWIEEQAREVFKSKPCSFVVVDRNQAGKPYLILVDSKRLIDAEILNERGDLGYIAFEHSVTKDGARACVYDEEKYLVFIKTPGSTEFVFESEAFHTVGYCPAVAFVSQSANSKNYFKRRVAFSGSGSKLEDWTIFDIFRNYTDHYAPFPVTEAPKNKCPNVKCKEGYIEEVSTPDPSNPSQTRSSFNRCEICAENDGGLIYPGTHIGITVQANKDLNDGSGVFKMIFPDTDKMKYIPEKLDELELEIRHKTVGLNMMSSVNEAVNKMQLSGSFASMETVLLRTKDELDILYKWIVETVANIYYKEIQLKVDANFGTEFYLISEDDLQKRFKEAKAIGLPQEELLMLYLQLVETKYKGNPNKVERQKMLIRLEPIPFFDTKEAMELKALNVIDNEILSMKVNFINFVSRFEAENVPITQFGLKLDPEKRIEKIKDTLNLYNKEAIAKIAAPVIEKAPITGA